MKLKPTDLLDVATPKVITRLLSDPIAKQAWKDAAFDSRYSGLSFEDENDMLRIATNPKFAAQTNPMAIATVLVDYLDIVLSAWKSATDNYSSNLMKASLPLFVEMSKYLPHVNPSDTYQLAFRGTDLDERQLKKFIKNNNNPKDWQKVWIDGVGYMIYTGPKKNQFVYTPHREVQSWSVSKGAAGGFGSELIATPIDLSFFFDPKFLSNYGYPREKETVHFGKKPMKVALMIRYRDYLNFKNDTGLRSWGESINESEQVSDEEGTLSIPL